MSSKFDDIHVRIKLLRNAIDQREGPADHQQIRGKTADALHKLHSGANHIGIFPNVIWRMTEHHSGQSQQGRDVHLAIEPKSRFLQRLVDAGRNHRGSALAPIY